MKDWLIFVLTIGILFLFSEWIEWTNGRRDNTPTFIKSMTYQAVLGEIVIMCIGVVIVCTLTGSK